MRSGQPAGVANLVAIAVAGQQHGMVVLDRPGKPAPIGQILERHGIGPRCRSVALVAAFGGPDWWAETVGVVPVASFTATKWAWLRRIEPDVAAATAFVRGSPMISSPNVSVGGEYPIEVMRLAPDGGLRTPATYVDEVLNIHLCVSTAPCCRRYSSRANQRVSSPGRPPGTWDFPPGIPVGPGVGDNAAAALGLGLEAGVPVISLGTSGTAFMVSESRIVDPSGTVAGFADATGRFLPLAATLNCTLAVDRVAGWLGLDREQVAAHTDVVVLPFFDGERTPNLPNAAASVIGLRHTTSPDEILLGAYQGAALGLLDALDMIDRHSSGIATDAPLILVGGGSKGPAWRHVVRAMSGRAVQIPEADELVALGAAAQAAALVTGEQPDGVARRWNTRRGTRLEPIARDDQARDRIKRVRDLTAALNA